jgi:Domain of unknown function (DUF4148)
MNASIKAITTTIALVVPAISFAQPSNGPLTRAQVREQLIQLERAGYKPARRDNMYPADIQAAEARISAQQSGATRGVSTSVGGTPSGASQSGYRAPSTDWNALYSHH